MPKAAQQKPPFNKILIANRGEIACRIIRTCKKLGIKTVAIYSEADASAMHVKMADESVLVGPPSPSESYLNIEAVILAAVETETEAIHPGYGFLSENGDFVNACEKANIRFIGPSAKVMDRMKDKAQARRLAAEAGLPLLPGVDIEDESDEIMELAQGIGYPVMVKASFGGGGIGIRIVETPDQLEQNMERAGSLAQSAFGDSHLYLEKYLHAPSHVEVQVLADSHGKAIHLFERDCSAQRRNQKVIEETPCIKIDQKQREAMYDSALNLVRHIGYTNAGTIEFLVDEKSKFYFIEMNTRLQVEHPITEMVTNLDIIEWQIRIAAGEHLTLSKKDIHSHGHSIEARIYPEDPVTSLPTAGTIERVKEPKGNDVRIDGSIFEGYEVLPYYDSLMSKVIVWGKTRDESIRKLYKALDKYHISGLTTNIPLIQKILYHPDFTEGNYSTNLLANLDIQNSKPSIRESSIEKVAIAAAVINEIFGTGHTDKPNPWKLHGRLSQMASSSNRGGLW